MVDTTDAVLSRDAAREIAARYRSDAAEDSPLMALAEGTDFDPRDLVSRVRVLLVLEATTDQVAELSALLRYAEQVRAIVIYTHTRTREDHDNEVHRDEDVTTEVFLIDDYTDDLGDWAPQGESDEVWVPASIVDTAAAILSGEVGPTNRFYAVETSAWPFCVGSWYSAECYSNPADDEVTDGTAHLRGFTPEEETAIYRRALPREAEQEDIRAAREAARAAERKAELRAEILAVTRTLRGKGFRSAAFAYNPGSRWEATRSAALRRGLWSVDVVFPSADGVLGSVTLTLAGRVVWFDAWKSLGDVLGVLSRAMDLVERGPESVLSDGWEWPTEPFNWWGPLDCVPLWQVFADAADRDGGLIPRVSHEFVLRHITSCDLCSMDADVRMSVDGDGVAHLEWGGLAPEDDE